MPSSEPRTSWLPGVATILSLAACYGTLALISILGALGIVIAVNDALWAGAIVGFAILAVIGLSLGLMRHRKPWPILLGALGAAVIAYTMYVNYDRMIEIAGFILLGLAAFWDWRIKKIG